MTHGKWAWPTLPVMLLSLAACAPSEPTVFVDLGDVVATSTAVPVDGMSASGQPDEAVLKVFGDAGYTAVIDMRGPDEDRGINEPAVVERLGMQYLSLPIINADDVSFDKARELDRLLESIDGPVLLHCASGNRVGALLALRHKLNGAADEEALQYGKDAGLSRLEDVVVQRLRENDR